MSKVNITYYAILGLLTHGDLTGYDIKKRIDVSISNFWDAGYGQIYPTLKTLEGEDLITKTTDPSEKGPDRIVYSITDAGKNKLIEWLLDSNEKEYVRYEILLKLFFGNMVPVEENMEKVIKFRERNAQKLNSMESIEENLKKVLEDHGDHLYYYLTLLFGKHLYSAYLKWADEVIDILNKKGC